MTEQEIKIRQQVAQSFQDIKTVADLTKLMNEVWSYLCKGVHKRIPLKDVTYFSNYKLAKDAYYKFLIPKKNGKTRETLTLAELEKTQVDMFTTVFIGNAATRELAGRMVTPRGYKR